MQGKWVPVAIGRLPPVTVNAVTAENFDAAERDRQAARVRSSGRAVAAPRERRTTWVDELIPPRQGRPLIHARTVRSGATVSHTRLRCDQRPS